MYVTAAGARPKTAERGIVGLRRLMTMQSSNIVVSDANVTIVFCHFQALLTQSPNSKCCTSCWASGKHKAQQESTRAGLVL